MVSIGMEGSKVIAFEILASNNKPSAISLLFAVQVEESSALFLSFVRQWKFSLFFRRKSVTAGRARAVRVRFQDADMTALCFFSSAFVNVALWGFDVCCT